ncbi:hypothetical protein L2D08_03745 [Domibacillus sp. PGB-M46]|nr:hypothetical protein [Domibacillus sp. PGB-M46]MCI2253474.1 hypothetical protein [Domibacillus sp. PGB-M46]
MFPVILWILIFVSFFVSVQIVSVYMKKAGTQEASELVPIEEKEDSSLR